MHTKLQNLRLWNGRQILAVFTLGLFLCATLAGMLNAPRVQAATSSTLNFQARLMNGDGGIVPDGNYNIEFKLYDTASTGGTAQGACSGNCLWVETRTGGNTVAVANGYVTVKLGSVNAFGGNINWDQELWLTMNIGGTGSPSWDGEMSPRLKLTAVPYAFRAGQLATQTGANTSTLGFDTQTAANSILLPDESGVLCIQGSSDCGFVENGAALSVGPSSVDIDGTLSVSTLGDADNADFLCYNSSNEIAACDTTGNGAVFVQGGNSFSGTAVLGTTNAENLEFRTNNVVRATFDTSNSLYLGNGVTAGAPNDFTVQGTGSTTTAVAGGSLTIQGGSATVGTANGGSVTITGGVGSGSGVLGLVNVGPTRFISSGSTQTFGSNGSVTGVDSYSTIAVSATADDLSVTVPAPDASNQVVGRILYITAVSGSNDFTLVLGGTNVEVSMKANSSATLLWNGTGWTAAGASSSTDLQSAYSNTQTSSGAAEVVLNAQGSGGADGVTIRNNDASPVVGALLEVQSSTGSNLFSVNNNAVEYAKNGGAETAGASVSTFPGTTWDTTTGGVVDRYNTSTGGFNANNIAAGQNSVRVQTTTTNHGARNRLSTSLTEGTTYAVSFAVRAATMFSTLQVLYSPDGTTSGTTQCATAQTVDSSTWYRVTCSFVASGTITGSNSILIRQTDGTARTFYVDNLSVVVDGSATLAADGSVDAALGSNWTNFGALDGLARETAIVYDTDGSVKVDAPNNTDRGVRNNLSSAPAANTRYLVTFYAQSSNTFNDIRVRYSRDGGTNFVSCADYNTQSLSTTSFTKVSCTFTTDGTTATDPDLIIDQPSASDREFYIDALSVVANTNIANNVQVGGANQGGSATLFTLDRSSGAPIASGNEAYLGSMYFDTTTGRIQCYEAEGWGACGAAPDNIVNLNPEYAGAVVNTDGTGTMSTDFCSNGTDLTVNAGLCATGQARNLYKWTSSELTAQTRSIYVTYQLPANFKGFASDDTVQLTGRVDNSTDASVTYEMYKGTGSDVIQCGSGPTDVIVGGGGTADTWHTYGISGNEATDCGFDSSSAGNFIVFKINLTASNNASAYVSTLSFVTTNR